MELSKFQDFRAGCARHLPGVVDQILKTGNGERRCAIGLVTTDDFYGFDVTWQFGSHVEIAEYYDWETADIALDTDFLYQPLVDVVEADEIDFCQPSEEKWGFAVELLTVLAETIRDIPEEVFQRNGFRREEVLFFATMSDGDYMEELLEQSVGLFNGAQTREAFGLAQS